MYRKLVRDFFFTFASTIATTILGFCSSVIVARLLGSENQGMLKEILTLPTLLYTFLNFGVESAIMYYGSKEKNFASIEKVTNKICLVYTLAIILISPLIYLLGQVYYKDIPIALLLSILPLPALTFYMGTQSALLRAENNFVRYNQIITVRQVVYTAVIALIFFIRSAWLVVIANYALVITGIIMSRAKAAHVDCGEPRQYTKDMLKYGFKFYLSSVINFFNYRFDIMMMTPIESKSQVGVYSIAQSLSELIWMIPNSVSTVLLPRLSGMKEEDKGAVALRVSRYVATLMLILVVVAFFLTQYLIPLVYSNKYSGAILPFKILLVGTFLMTYGKIFVNATASYGKPERNFPAIIAGSLSNIVLNIFLIPRFGIIGAAIAGSISYSIMSLATILNFVRLNNHRIKIRDMLIVNRADILVMVDLIKKKAGRQ